jgi:hypothetical protein
MAATMRTKLKLGKFVFLVVVVAATGSVIAWLICSSSCPVPADPGKDGSPGGPSAVATWLSAAVAAVATWFLTSFLGKPLLDIRAKRLAALQIAERYGGIPEPTSEAGAARVTAARSALIDIAVDLRTLARGLSWPLAYYCRLARYDLDLAALVIGGISEMAGSDRYSQELKTNNLDVVYYSLNAYKHLSADRVAEVERLIAELLPAVEAKRAAKNSQDRSTAASTE